MNQIVVFFCIRLIFDSDATGSFPDYPDEEDGGSALIFAEKDPQQVKSQKSNVWFIACIFTILCKRRLMFGVRTFIQLMEEIAAKEEEDSNNKPKGKEEKKEKGKKDKGKEDEEVRSFYWFNITFSECHLFKPTLARCFTQAKMLHFQWTNATLFWTTGRRGRVEDATFSFSVRLGSGKQNLCRYVWVE